MSDSEAKRKGAEMRRKLLGDAFVERANKNTYADPVMKEFIEVATEAVFGTLWTRPGAGSQDAHAGLRHLRRRHRARAGAGRSTCAWPCGRAGRRRS